MPPTPFIPNGATCRRSPYRAIHLSRQYCQPCRDRQDRLAETLQVVSRYEGFVIVEIAKNKMADLAQLDGKSVLGDWKRMVSDHAGTDAGKLRRWGLKLTL
jgi:hypothetical protein